MNADDDYQYDFEGIMEVDEAPSRTEAAPEQVAGEPPLIVREEPLVDRSAEQIAEGLPVAAEKSVVSAHTEKSREKTSKRQRTGTSSDKGKDLSTGRRIHYRDAGFVEDIGACASVLYALKHPEASGDVPPLSELEESEAYAKYARNEMKNQALLNKIIVDYQRKLNEARQASKDSEEVVRLKIDLDKQCAAVTRFFTRLEEKKKENISLQADLKARTDELAEARSLADRQVVELKALGEYSKEVKTRADRLRERLVYLNNVKSVSKRADQARSTLRCLNGLVKSGVRIPPKVLFDMEKDARAFEAELKEIQPVELEERDLSPLGAYVPMSDEFEELLGTEVPPKPYADESTRDQNVREVLETLNSVPDPSAVRPYAE